MSIKDYPARLTSGYYRVRQTWDDAASQLGAFRLLANAMAKADANPGYFVFSNEGEAIYPETESGIEEAAEVPEKSSGEAELANDSAEDTADAEEKSAETVKSGDAVPPAEETENTPLPTDAAADNAPETAEESGTGTLPDAPEDESFPEAVEYEYDGNDTPVAYAKLKTLMNIRDGNSLEAESITTYKKDTVVEVLQVCENGWLRIRCIESGTGFAYVSGDAMYNHGLGSKLYTVAAKDNLWKIAEEQLGDGTRYPEIRELNGLTCNVIRVGMQLVLP